MIVNQYWKSAFLILALFPLTLTASAWGKGFPGGIKDALGPHYSAPPQLPAAARSKPQPELDVVRRWNTIAVNASGLDHTPVAPGEDRVFGEQLGPGRSSRAMAIVHIAIFDAMNAVVGRYKSYTDLPPAPAHTSIDAAIAQAAHDTLSALFPSQQASFDEQLAEDLGRIQSKRAQENGIDLGRLAAATILARRSRATPRR